MTYQTIKLTEDERGIATLKLYQPEIHNAMSGKMIDELTDAATRISESREIRLVVLTAEGKSFCAGGDLRWMRSQFEADRSTRVAEAMKLARMLNLLNTLPKPMIGRIQGQAYGGGIGLISTCDLTIAAEQAKFALTETRLGLVPATISPYVVARMGESNARKVFMSGKPFRGEEAVRLGLISRAVADTQLDLALEEEIAPYLQAAPGAVARAKRLVRKLGPVIDEDVMKSTAEELADCWESKETQQGIEAFFAKEKPAWQKSV